MKRLTLFLFCVCAANGAKILGVFPMPMPSHFFTGFQILRELANRGHQVTMISPFPRDKPIKNYRDVSTKGVEVFFAGIKEHLIDLVDQSPFTSVTNVGSLADPICNYTLSSESVQNLLKSNEHFDLIIIEDFLIPSLTALAWYFNAPFIYVSAIGANTWNSHYFGNPNPASYIPHMLTRYTSKMSFFQRLYNLLLTTYDISIKDILFYPSQNKILHQYFPEAPHLNEIIYNASLILLNSHSSVTDPVPHLPNMIQIGGIHFEEPKPLPEDLQKFLDEADEGVVYFSMGSNLRSADLHLDKREAILRALGKLKQKVLWKFETDDIVNLPKNVKISKWLPQSDVLAHPNVKVFISHGGMLSNLESVYHGVPIVGIPIFADQKMNTNTAVNKGYAIALSYHDLSEQTLSAALNEILYNPRYSENAKWRSILMRDQPLKPKDAAVYWVEYAIRHPRCDHFRSAALDLPWYKLYMWDVAAFLILLTFAIVFAFYRLIRITFSWNRCNTKEKIQ